MRFESEPGKLAIGERQGSNLSRLDSSMPSTSSTARPMGFRPMSQKVLKA